MEDLKVTAVFDGSNLKRGLDDVQKELAQTAVTAAKLDSSLKKVAPGANQATNSLLNLGRIAQDAQFGFIGIANNINPALESFQRLQKETGSTKGALKSLVGALAGAGGLGFAVSLAIPIIGFITQGFSAWTRGMGSNKKALDENAKAAKEAADAYKQIVDAVGKESATIEVIVEKLKNENITRKQRSALIKELQDTAPAYFATLNTEKSTIDEITAAYNRYAGSLNLIVKARAIEKQLDEVVSKRIALQIESTKRNNQVVSSTGRLVTAQNQIYDATQKTNKSLSEYQKFSAGVSNLTNEETQELNNLIATEKVLVRTLASIKPINIKPDKTKKDIETVDDVLKKLRHDIEVLNEIGFLEGFDPAKQILEALKTARKTLIDKFGLSKQDRPVIELGVEIDQAELNEKLKTAVANIKTEALANPIPIPLTVTPLSADKLAEEIAKAVKRALGKMAKAAADELQDIIDSLNRGLAQSVNNSLNSSIASIAQGIGDAIGKGGDLGKAIFGNLFEVLAAGIKQIGESLIALGTAKLALEKFKFAPGVATIAAGFAAVLVGSLLQATIPKFATGGFVNGPGSATSDSIHAKLSKGEYVINAATVSKFGKGFFDNINGGNRPRNNQFAGGGFVSGSIGGGISQTIIPDVVLRGTDLVLVFNRAQKRLGRNG